MRDYSRVAMERAMKIQEIILRAIAKKIMWLEAAQIIGVSPRQMRRGRQLYVQFGSDGLFDRSRGMPSPKRVPLKTVGQMPRSQHFD